MYTLPLYIARYSLLSCHLSLLHSHLQGYNYPNSPFPTFSSSVLMSYTTYQADYCLCSSFRPLNGIYLSLSLCFLLLEVQPHHPYTICRQEPLKQTSQPLQIVMHFYNSLLSSFHQLSLHSQPYQQHL